LQRQYLYYILFFVLGLLIGLVGFRIIELAKKNISEEKPSVSQPTKEKKVENKFILKKKVAVWLPWYDQDQGFEVLKNNRDKISTVKPFWYQVKKDGSLKKFSGAEDEEIINFAKENNIQLVPTITNECEPYESEKMLKSKTARAKNIENILELVVANDYDGIEVNYECLSDKSLRSIYSNFISQLSDRLHEKGKILSSAVHAKTNDQGEWEGAFIQDWKILGKKCDQIKIMTYDYHWSTSEAGNIAPISWMREVLDYAVKVLPRDKIYLGIHFYGYDWQGEEARDLTYSDVLELIERYKPKIKLSKEKEKYFVYNEGGEKHKVYFADHETIIPRIELVSKYKIAGIGIWRIGQEDEKNWQTIAKVFKK